METNTLKSWHFYLRKNTFEQEKSCISATLFFNVGHLDFFNQDQLNDGGAAMMAWAYMQFSEMSHLEQQRISKALLRYCELDTMAMVMIYEYFASKL